MKELKEETSTQKIYWDSENEIVWVELFADILTEELAKEDIDAQERIRDKLNKEKKLCDYNRSIWDLKRGERLLC